MRSRMRFSVRRVAVEIGARAQEPLEQEGALHQIGAVILAAERFGRAGLAMHEMRVEAVIAGRPLEAVEHYREAGLRLRSRHPSALAGDDQSHHAKAGAADGHDRRPPGRQAVRCDRAQARSLGCAPSQKKRKVWRWTRSSRRSSDSFSRRLTSLWCGLVLTECGIDDLSIRREGIQWRIWAVRPSGVRVPVRISARRNR